MVACSYGAQPGHPPPRLGPLEVHPSCPLANSQAHPVPPRCRGITTSTVSPTEELALLNKQRNLRPNSPWHIYQPQLTAITSIANRATGAGLSVGAPSPCPPPHRSLSLTLAPHRYLRPLHWPPRPPRFRSPLRLGHHRLDLRRLPRVVQALRQGHRRLPRRLPLPQRPPSLELGRREACVPPISFLPRRPSDDSSAVLDLKTSYAAGYTVLAATALSGTYLTFFL